MARINVAPLTRSQMSKIAEAYLAKNHPTGTLPIPIEDIIDLKEKIDIVSVEDLRADGHEAFTSKDRKTIYVDKGVYSHKNQNRFRFTLAHELSHLLLHGDIFESANYSDIAGFKGFLAELGDEQVRRLEDQAYKTAGFLLVPTADLSEEYSSHAQKLAAASIDIRNLEPSSLKHVAKKIGERFGVSWAVIHRRAVYEGLWAWDDIPES